VGFGGFAYKIGSEPMNAASEFAELNKQSNYSAAYDSIGQAWKDTMTREEFTAFFEDLETRLGKLQDISFRNINMQSSNDGSTCTVDYVATYAKGTGTYTVTLYRVGGEWVVVGLNVNSAQLNNATMMDDGDDSASADDVAGDEDASE
jgi:hypothetical protein